MKPLVISSNIYNEIDQLPRWFEWVKQVADGGILIVDSGSTDGSIEYAKSQGAIVIVDDFIRQEGYGPARSQLRELSKQYFPEAHWMAYFDADEDIDEKEFHILRWIKDYLVEDYDVVALPRIDWFSFEKEKAANDFRFSPDWQARMTRLDSPIIYERKLHEVIVGYKKIYTNLTNPKINHYHRDPSLKAKREVVGLVCAKLHMEDNEYGHTYPMHPSEQKYRDQYIKEGLK